MVFKTCFVAGVVAFMAESAQAGNPRTTAIGRKAEDPRLETCEPACFFQNEDNSWCLNTTPPMLQVGWLWDQNFGTTAITEVNPVETLYWQLELQTYYEAQVYIENIFDIQRLIYNEFIVDLSKYKQYYFFSMIINSYNEVCLGYGWESEIIELDLSTRWHAQDCYKDIITDICNWSTSFNGYDAKWFDQCSESLEVNIPVKNTIYREERNDVMLRGTVDPNSRRFCYALPIISQENTNLTGVTEGGFSKFPQLFMEHAYPTIGSWIKNNYS